VNAEASQDSVNQPSHVSGVSSPTIVSETYLDTLIAGVKVSCLIDTGSDYCLIPKSRVRNAVLTPVHVDLYAANGTHIPVLGTVRLGFKLLNSPTPLYADFLVPDLVDEIMLGFNWLRENKCRWLFDRATLVVAGRPTKLKYRPSRTNIRRIYARERVVIHPNSSATVPVRMPFSSLHTPVSEWTAEPKQIKSGLLVGRTIVSHNDTFAAMHIINLSGNCHVLKRDYFLGEAQPGVVCDEVDCSFHVAGDKTRDSECRDDEDETPVKTTVGNAAAEISVGTGNAGTGRVANFIDDTVGNLGQTVGRCFNGVHHEVGHVASADQADSSGEAKLVNLDNSVKFHFSESYDPLPHCAEFNSPAVSCEVEFKHPPIIADKACWISDIRPPAVSREPDFTSLSPAVRRTGEFRSLLRTWSASEPICPVQAGRVSIANELVDREPCIVSTQSCTCAAMLCSRTAHSNVPNNSLGNGYSDKDFVVKLWSTSYSSRGFARSIQKRNCNTVLSPTVAETLEGGEFACDNSHVNPVIESLPDDLTFDERDRAIQLITANADIFSQHEYDYGRTDLLTLSIDTGDHKPIAQPLRRHPRAYLDLIDETVNKLLESRVIEPAASPWNFNVVLVAKPNKPTPRVTIDYRALNAITYKDHFPLPKIRECLDTLSGSIYFSTLDLSGSFFQLGLRESDRDKTAFSTRMGQWRFAVMPMKSCNSPSFFSRLMSVALRGLTYSKCLVFIDDSIVIGRTFDEHLASL